MRRFTLIEWDDGNGEEAELVSYVYNKRPNDPETLHHREGDVTEIISGRAASYQTIQRMLDTLEG